MINNEDDPGKLCATVQVRAVKVLGRLGTGGTTYLPLSNL